MKQHILLDQIKELDFEERIILLSFVSGLDREYVRAQYEQERKEELGKLRADAFLVNIGEMIEIVENYTGQFPAPGVKEGKYSINISLTNRDGEKVEASTAQYDEYCDALFEVVKKLLIEKYIE